MTAGSVAVPTIIPLRAPQGPKHVITSATQIEVKSGTWRELVIQFSKVLQCVIVLKLIHIQLQVILWSCMLLMVHALRQRLNMDDCVYLKIPLFTSHHSYSHLEK